MKLKGSFFAFLCITSLVNAKSEEIQTTHISANDAAVACGMVGLSYWINYKLKGFFKDLPKGTDGGGLLPRHIVWLNSPNFGPTIVREMITAGLFTTTVLGVKTLIADNFVSTGAQIASDGKAIKGQSPAWFEKAWTTGLMLAFARLAYDMYGNSATPDIVTWTKSWLKNTK